MKKIIYATLVPTMTMNENGEYCEFSYNEASEAEYGEEWNGNVIGYVENLDLDDNLEISSDYVGAIHNEPDGAIVLVDQQTKHPVEMFWSI